MALQYPVIGLQLLDRSPELAVMREIKIDGG
jgi:hypothetical protein